MSDSTSCGKPVEPPGAEHHPRTAPPPFDNPHADITLRSSDDVDFCVWRAILTESSATFAEMFTFPQPKSMCDHTQQPEATRTVPVTEPSATIEPLLRLCYPIPDPAFTSLGELQPVLESARKYQMDYAMQRIAGQLLELADTNALGAWAIAVRFQLVDTAKATAKLCLKTPLPWPFAEELEHITGADYHHLVEYREMHVKAACDVLTDLGWLNGDNYFICVASSGKSCTKDKRMLPWGVDKLSKWFCRHLDRMKVVLRATPSAEALKEPFLWDQVYVDAGICSDCRLRVPGGNRSFTARLVAEVEDRASKIVFEFKPTA